MKERFDSLGGSHHEDSSLPRQATGPTQIQKTSQDLVISLVLLVESFSIVFVSKIVGYAASAEQSQIQVVESTRISCRIHPFGCQIQVARIQGWPNTTGVVAEYNGDPLVPPHANTDKGAIQSYDACHRTPTYADSTSVWTSTSNAGCQHSSRNG